MVVIYKDCLHIIKQKTPKFIKGHDYSNFKTYLADRIRHKWVAYQADNHTVNRVSIPNIERHVV